MKYPNQEEATSYLIHRTLSPAHVSSLAKVRRGLRIAAGLRPLPEKKANGVRKSYTPKVKARRRLVQSD